MNSHAKRITSALLAALMLFLSIASMGMTAGAEKEGALIAENDFSSSDSHGFSYSNDYATVTSTQVLNLPSEQKLFYKFGDRFTNPPSEGASSATLTLSFTLIPNGNNAQTYIRLANASASKFNNENIARVRATFVELCGGPNYALTPGVPVDFAFVITITNGQKTTVDTYVNGELYAQGALGTAGVPTVYGGGQDLGAILFHNSGDTRKTVTYDNIRLYEGVDPVTTSATVISPLSGASIRLDKNAETSGLRFSFEMDKARFDALGASEHGALIAPTDWLTDGTLSALTYPTDANAEYKPLVLPVDGFSSESTEDTYRFNASIVKLLPQNFAREFTAVGYVKVGDTYYYSECSDSRSIIDVALKYGNSPEYAAASAENQTIVDAYRSKVVYLTVTESGAAIETIEGYAPAYEVSYEGGVLSLSGAGVKNIATIVLNGDIYTDGWFRLDGEEKISAELVLS